MSENLAAVPARHAVAVTPSDATLLTFRALFVGTAGAVAVRMASGVTITFTGVLAGSILPIQGTQVLLTGTSPGTNIVALA